MEIVLKFINSFWFNVLFFTILVALSVVCFFDYKGGGQKNALYKSYGFLVLILARVVQIFRNYSFPGKLTLGNINHAFSSLIIILLTIIGVYLIFKKEAKRRERLIK